MNSIVALLIPLSVLKHLADQLELRLDERIVALLIPLSVLKH